MEEPVGKYGRLHVQILALRLLSCLTSEHLCFSRPHVQCEGAASAGAMVPPAVRVCGFHQAEGGERETQAPGVGNGFENIKMEAESKGWNNYCKRQCQ